MSIGNTYNQTSIDLAEAKYQNRFREPSLIEKQSWHQEFLESGAQYRMSFPAFQKLKTQEWETAREQRNWRFGGGKYHGEPIRKILRTDPDYINWVLGNNPKSKLTRQIVLFCRYNNIIMAQIENNSKLKNMPEPRRKK